MNGIQSRIRMRSWAAALLAALTAGTAAGQGSGAGQADPLGLVGAFQRLERKEVAPSSVLDGICDLGAGIAESGKKARLKELMLSEGQSLLRLEVEDSLVADAIRDAINAKPRRITVEEAEVASDPKTGRVIVEYRVVARPGAPPDEPKPRADESVARRDFGEHLQLAAARMGVMLESFEKLGQRRSAQQGFEKVIYRFVLGPLDPDVVARFLSHLHRSWPGVELDELSVKEAARATKGDPPAWTTTVTTSISRESPR